MRFLKWWTVICLCGAALFFAAPADAEGMLAFAPGGTEDGFSMEILSVTYPKTAARRVYIYHTHTYEAYTMDEENRYRQTEEWRTADEKYNMIRVGEELTRLLREAGVEVTHDLTAYEPPRLSTAYARSLEGLEKTLDTPYDLYIDLHRDAYSQGNGANTVVYDGADCARVLILVGKGTGQMDEAQRPDWQANEKIGKAISAGMNSLTPDICRGVALKSGRYNQHIAPACLLVEAGNNRNTLPEALNAMRPLSLAICAWLDGVD